ncbi:hypothetical protein MW887_003465 [Aspergillus wentii]|nr:hypothetical protein MW887_003465 [Aspergillus wentii]
MSSNEDQAVSPSASHRQPSPGGRSFQTSQTSIDAATITPTTETDDPIISFFALLLYAHRKMISRYCAMIRAGIRVFAGQDIENYTVYHRLDTELGQRLGEWNNVNDERELAVKIPPESAGPLDLDDDDRRFLTPRKDTRPFDDQVQAHMRLMDHVSSEITGLTRRLKQMATQIPIGSIDMVSKPVAYRVNLRDLLDLIDCGNRIFAAMFNVYRRFETLALSFTLGRIPDYTMAPKM